MLMQSAENSMQPCKCSSKDSEKIKISSRNMRYYFMLRLHYATCRQGSHDSQNVARCGILVIFVFVFKFCSVSFSPVCQGICDIGSTLHYGLPRIIVRSPPPPGLSRSVGTSHVLLRANQVLLHLSSSIQVFYSET